MLKHKEATTRPLKRIRGATSKSSTVNLHFLVSAIKLVAVQEQTICQLGMMLLNLLAVAPEMDWSLRKQDVRAHKLHWFQVAFATSSTCIHMQFTSASLSWILLAMTCGQCQV